MGLPNVYPLCLPKSHQECHSPPLRTGLWKLKMQSLPPPFSKATPPQHIQENTPINMVIYLFQSLPWVHGEMHFECLDRSSPITFFNLFERTIARILYTLPIRSTRIILEIRAMQVAFKLFSNIPLSCKWRYNFIISSCHHTPTGLEKSNEEAIRSQKLVWGTLKLEESLPSLPSQLAVVVERIKLVGRLSPFGQPSVRCLSCLIFNF